MTDRPLRHHDETLGIEFRQHPQRGDIVDVTRVADGRQIDQIHCAEAPEDIDELETLANAWIRQRVGATPPAPRSCSGCGSELEPATNHDTDYQFRGALAVTFSGGYGMFIDALGDGTPDAILCRRCANDMRAELPWAAVALDKLR